MTLTFLAAFGAAFIFVFLKAWQQLNVQHDLYWLVVPTSIGMAVCEVYVVANVARYGWNMPLVLLIGLGSGLGCILSMWLHKKVRHERTRRSE